MIQRLLRLEIGGRHDPWKGVEGFAILGEVLGHLIFHDGDVGVEFVGLEQNRHRLLRHADATEQHSVGDIGRHELRVLLDEHVVTADEALQLALEARLVEVVALGLGLGKNIALPLHDVLERFFREGLGPQHGCEQTRQQSGAQADFRKGNGMHGA